MISDTLSDAAAEIRDYLRDMPEVYGSLEPEINQVLAVMDALRIKLDAPPPLPFRPRTREEADAHYRVDAEAFRAAGYRDERTGGGFAAWFLDRGKVRIMVVSSDGYAALDVADVTSTRPDYWKVTRFIDRGGDEPEQDVSAPGEYATAEAAIAAANELLEAPLNETP